MKEEGDGVRAIGGGDEVKVIGHQAVRGDVYAAFLAMRFEEREEVFAIGVAREDGLAVVAALGEMEPVSGRGEAISAGQGDLWCLRLISGFRRGEISSILQKSCGKCLRGGFCGGEVACFDGDRGKVRDTRGWYGFFGWHGFFAWMARILCGQPAFRSVCEGLDTNSSLLRLRLRGYQWIPVSR